MVTLKNGMVEFSFYRPEARNVNVAGDFNGWMQNNLSMSRDERGYWRAIVELPAGEFKFRYCADGEWFTDYAAFGVEPGRFGMDSIVRVPAHPLKVTQPTKLTKIAAA